jgi:hypothetical protein
VELRPCGSDRRYSTDDFRQPQRRLRSRPAEANESLRGRTRLDGEAGAASPDTPSRATTDIASFRSDQPARGFVNWGRHSGDRRGPGAPDAGEPPERKSAFVGHALRARDAIGVSGRTSERREFGRVCKCHGVFRYAVSVAISFAANCERRRVFVVVA